MHFNTKYGSFLNAINYPDGLAVVGFFIKLIDGPVKSAGRPAELLQTTVDHLGLIRFKGHDVELPAEASQVREMMPPVLDRYFTYLGSLTAPPLLECVTWIVMTNTITLTVDQLAAFRDLRRLTNFEPANNNMRACCPLNGRTIRSSKPLDEMDAALASAVLSNACSE